MHAMLKWVRSSLQVQLAKLAGCHVIGTCSTDAKAEFLKVGFPVQMLALLCD